MVPSKTSFWFVLLFVAGAIGCRIDDRNQMAREQEGLLADGSWKTFSEVYYPGQGYRIEFLRLGMVAQESGRMSDSWAINEPDVLEITNSQNQTREYRLFSPHNLLAYCHPGFEKPFLMAPDSLSYSDVLEAARKAGVYNCDGAAILSIAGARIERLQDMTHAFLSVDVRAVELDWRLRSAIRDLKDVRNLNMSGVVLRNDDLAYLSPLGGLEVLDLSNTDIGDDGLLHLYGLGSLRLLNLSGTRVTIDGIRLLMDELPDLDVLPSSNSG